MKNLFIALALIFATTSFVSAEETAEDVKPIDIFADYNATVDDTTLTAIVGIGSTLLVWEIGLTIINLVIADHN